MEFYADNKVYYNEDVNNGYDGDLEIAIVPDSFRKDVLGETLDANNVLVEKGSQTGAKFALLFEFMGDQSAKRHVLYYCTATRPKIEGSTKTASKDIKTDSFSFKARPMPGTDTEVKASTTPTTDAAAYNAWYTTVYRLNSTVTAVTAIDVAGAGAVDTLAVGNTLAMIATITPANASDPRVEWSVETLVGGTATINALTGVLTATGAGTVTVKATNKASGIIGTKTITITAA